MFRATWQRRDGCAGRIIAAALTATKLPALRWCHGQANSLEKPELWGIFLGCQATLGVVVSGRFHGSQVSQSERAAGRPRLAAKPQSGFSTAGYHRRSGQATLSRMTETASVPNQLSPRLLDDSLAAAARGGWAVGSRGVHIDNNRFVRLPVDTLLCMSCRGAFGASCGHCCTIAKQL